MKGVAKHTPSQQETDWLRKKIAASTVEEGACLIWQLALSNAGPIVMMPRDMPNRRQLRVRRVLLENIMGKKEPKPEGGPRYVPVAKCGDPKCLRQEHQAWVTVSEQQRMTAKRTGYHLDPVRNTKIRNSLNRRKLTDEQVAALRSSSASIRQVSSEAGVSFEAARQAKNGISYKDYSSPWAGLMR